jgi:anti-sigma regulatory factor (Ser/Thr protein kinase)
VADRRALADVRRFVADEAGRHAPSAIVHDLQLAVTEACANSILHSGTREFRVSVAPVGSCLEITIEDDGVYRHVLPVPEADGTGHRGLHLMAAMVDDFTLHRGTKGRPGTVVRLVKCRG